jgi:hypothetical protein
LHLTRIFAIPALLEKALELNPQFALAHARIGYVYAARMGEGAKAKPYLEKVPQT